MFHLTEDELDRAYGAITHHGYSALLPRPPEWKTVTESWPDMRTHLAKLDLDEYRPYTPLRLYAPKSRILVRPLTLLHPQDLLIYTALVLVCRDAIEAQRLPVEREQVFSFRADPDRADRLYQANDAHVRYQKKLTAKAEASNTIAVADIADFYPRIYQHRLENVLKTISLEERIGDVGRVLADKFLFHISRGDSYGIPIGPFASRVLAEAILIDVDAALANEGFDFVRWVDDFNFFCTNEREAERALFFLAEWLFDKHGLTLQPSKTRILSQRAYKRRLNRDYEERIKNRSGLAREYWDFVKASEYSDDEAKALASAEIAKIDADELVALLKEALADIDAVDYDLADFVIGRLGSLDALPDEKKVELIDVILEHIDHLYPIASGVARFFLSFDTLEANTRKRVATALLAPLKKEGHKPPDYYAMWMMSIFAESPEWNSADDLRAIYTGTSSPFVKRYAALALAATGNRAHALAVRSDFEQALPLVRTAILLCTRKLGSDERNHWRRLSSITGFLEKRL